MTNVIHLRARAAEQTAQEVFSAAPLLTTDEISGAESTMQTPGFANERRLALSMCAMSGEWFEQIGGLPRDAALAVAANYHAMRGHVDALRALANVIESAHARVLVGLSVRNDAEELIAQTEEVFD